MREEDLIKVSDEVRKLLDSNDNTSLSKEAIFEWFNDFVSLADENLRISRKTFIKFYRQFLPKRGYPDLFCEYVFRAYDSKSTGYIDFFEFTMAIAISSSHSVEHKLTWMFKVYDITKTGYIDFHEFKKIIKSIYLMNNISHTKQSFMTKCREVFKELDTNKDRRISREEFIHACLNDEFLFYFLNPIY